MADSRVPFIEAVSDPLLLKDFFDTLSFPQRVVLKSVYGCELSDKVVNPNTGFSELDYWAITQGSCEYDELGYVTKVNPIPYSPKEYNQLWAVVGRRAGKTSQLQSFIIAYEATLGGHEDYIATGQECLVYLIAQQLDVARANMPFVRHILDTSPLLSKEVEREIQDLIRLKNGISIVPSSPSIKKQRGLACPVVAMDEVSFWYIDADSANPDFEVERAVAKSQLQFPNYKRIGISTPWVKDGLLWKYYRAGTEGIKLPLEQREPYNGKLVCFGTTASFENPVLEEAGGRKRLLEERNEDEAGFERECLCVFPDSISGFLNRLLVENAFDKAKGIAERSPVDPNKTNIIPTYVAAIDPAFRGDDFAFCIVHRDGEKGLVVDLLKHWTPLRGMKLNPKEILAEIRVLTEPYSVHTLYSDQYQLESMQQLALDMGMSIEGVDFTSKSKSKIYGSLEKVVNQNKIEVLDFNLSRPAAVLFQQLIQLERRQTPGGGIQISAPEGKHDDLATVLALAAFKSTWLEPTVTISENPFREKSAFELCQETINRKNRLNMEDW